MVKLHYVVISPLSINILQKKILFHVHVKNKEKTFSSRPDSMLRKRKTGDICCNYALALYNFEVYLKLQKFHVIFDSGLELST